MPTEGNKSLVRRYYDEVLNRRQLSLIDELFAPTFMGRCSNYPEISLDQLKQAVAESHAALPDLQVTVEDPSGRGRQGRDPLDGAGHTAG